MAAFDVSHGSLTPGDFVMIQALFMQLAAPLNQMGMLFRQIDQSQVDFEDLYFMLRQEPLIQEKSNASEFQFKEGKIEFRDIEFKHMMTHPGLNDTYLFKGMNLSIQPGTKNAIVGHSGFGKTTLINLLVRTHY